MYIRCSHQTGKYQCHICTPKNFCFKHNPNPRLIARCQMCNPKGFCKHNRRIDHSCAKCKKEQQGKKKEHAKVEEEMPFQFDVILKMFLKFFNTNSPGVLQELLQRPFFWK